MEDAEGEEADNRSEHEEAEEAGGHGRTARSKKKQRTQNVRRMTKAWIRKKQRKLPAAPAALQEQDGRSLRQRRKCQSQKSRDGQSLLHQFQCAYITQGTFGKASAKRQTTSPQLAEALLRKPVVVACCNQTVLCPMRARKMFCFKSMSKYSIGVESKNEFAKQQATNSF